MNKIYTKGKAGSYELCKRCLNCFCINRMEASKCGECGLFILNELKDDNAEFERRRVPINGEKIDKINKTNDEY